MLKAIIIQQSETLKARHSRLEAQASAVPASLQ